MNFVKLSSFEKYIVCGFEIHNYNCFKHIPCGFTFLLLQKMLIVSWQISRHGFTMFVINPQNQKYVPPLFWWNMFCIFCLMLLTISNFNKIFLKEYVVIHNEKTLKPNGIGLFGFRGLYNLKKKKKNLKKPMIFLMNSVFYFIFLFFGLITDYYFLWFSCTKLKFTRKIS